MADMQGWTTAISKIVSDETEEECIIRGQRLTRSIGQRSFAEMTFLMLAGCLPSPGQAATLDALMTAAIDHGIVPPSMIARSFASYGTSATAAIGAGVLTFGSITGGAGEPLAREMVERVAAVAGADRELGDDELWAIARSMVQDAKRDGNRLPGFGIPVHKTDPRSPILLKIAKENGVFGTYCRLLVLLEDELAQAAGRKIPINLDGVGAALVLDLGFPWQTAAALIMIPRTISMLAHYLEEKDQGTKWRHIPPSQISYTGPMPEE